MGVWFLFMGVVCLHRTHQIQQWFGNFYEKVPAAAAWKFFFDWTQSKNFVFVTRILGVLSMINFLMLFYVAFNSQGIDISKQF
ncbi:MAG: hypothetical protein OEZ43_00820 [Gammaproteobacteria bacterium]|nr:hypothetical protein [Gammaproteobacteria bacterium]